MTQRIALVILIWNTYNLRVAYSFADHHKFGISITLSLLLAVIAISVTVAGLGTKNGMLKLFDYPGGPLAPGPILAYALSFAGAFGCLHFNISLLNSSAYNGLHDWQDSLYFSVVTLATVGYADITPLSHIARWACMVEIVMGFVILVIALNATMSIWLQRTPSLKIEPGAAAPEERSDLPVPVLLPDSSHLE
jgi:Ion channel